MTIKEFIKKYNLHDSLLESITYDEIGSRVTLSIDFCYWQQEDCEEGENETGMILVKFDNVSRLDYVPYQINSDEIVEISSVDDEITFTVFNDIMNDNVDIIIKADNVSVSV